MNNFKKFLNSEGLTSDSILNVISQIESTKISTFLKFKLMACLIPKQSIPEEAFIRMTCLLGDLQFDVKLKVEILKWMISVYSFVDNLDNFQILIEVFLQLLENKTLRPYVCHLLHKMTRKEHVTLKRIKHIFKLLEKCEPEPCLAILLSLYSKHLTTFTVLSKEDIKYDYESLGIYPNLIKSVHPLYDAYIPTNYFLNADASVPLPPFSIRVEKSSQLSVTESANVEFSNTWSDVPCDFLTIHKEFESMKRPSKIQKILKNKFRRLFLTTDISQIEKNCFENYIFTSMYFNLGHTDFLGDSLEVLRDMPHPVPGISYITEEYIERWDGSSGLDAVMELLSYEQLCCFEKFEYKLDLVQEKLLSASLYEKCNFINCFSNLYECWVLREYEEDSPEPHQNYFCTFSDDCSLMSENHQVANQIHKLGNYIALMCDAYLLDNNFHPCLLNEILNHCERVSRCHIAVNNLVMHPPTTTIFHAALFSLSSITLDSLCSLMMSYCLEIKNMRRNKNPESDLADVYFKRYGNDILKLLLQGILRPKETTHLSRENVMNDLKVVHPNFEIYFDLCRHPALVQSTALFISNNGKDISCSEINKVPHIRRIFFKHLEHNGQEFLVKFLKLFVNYKKKENSVFI